MGRTVSVYQAGFASLCLSVGVAFADELKPPVVPQSDVSSSMEEGAGCTLAPPGPIVGVRLFVRNSERGDVGPYRVKLAGYALGSTDEGQDTFRPLVVRAKPGDTLRFDLTNQLDAADPSLADNVVNLHTHGLIVAPRPFFPCNTLGDYIFDSVGPTFNKTGVTHSFSYRIDIPEKIRGLGSHSTQPFPSGLYWIHSHVHGSAQNQLMAGQSGVLAIEPREHDATSDFREQSDERFLILRDIQLGAQPSQTPDKLQQGAPQEASWLSGDAYDTQACRKESNPGIAITKGLGYCAHAGVFTGSAGSAYDPTQDLAWLFTINGQVGPTITINPGRSQIWRIANTSATVAYVLDLIDDSRNEKTLHVLTLDGVISGTPDPSTPGQEHPTVALTHLLLMPASRAEVLVPNTNDSASDAVLTLRTLGLETGGANQPVQGDPNDPVAQHNNYVGDPWPPVDLAKVVLKASPKAASLTDLLSQTFTRGTDNELIAFAAAAKPPATPDGCITLPNPDTRRRITLDEASDSPSFWIGSEVVESNGSSVDAGGSNAHTIPPVPFEHAAPPLSIRHVCAKLGSDEVWEVVNNTNELHNFHIHQSKFRLARPGDAGLPADFTASDAIADPAGVLASQVPDFGAVGTVRNVDVWHDTIPVPPAKLDENRKVVAPGKTFVMIPFEDPVQVGAFVFHCHVLEHEDKGMMATIEVFDPANPEKSRQGADAGKFLPTHGARGRYAGFCGKLPENYSVASLLAPDPAVSFWSRLARLSYGLK
jgi:FtsP/CotA-like multicopper oxidase with cupredoxin domain